MIGLRPTTTSCDGRDREPVADIAQEIAEVEDDNRVRRGLTTVAIWVLGGLSSNRNRRFASSILAPLLVGHIPEFLEVVASRELRPSLGLTVRPTTEQGCSFVACGAVDVFQGDQSPPCFKNAWILAS